MADGRISERARESAALCCYPAPRRAQSNTTTEDVHFAIEMEQLPAWIADVSAIFEKDLLTDNRLGGPKCMGPGYIWLRFGYPRGEYLHMG